ncbi:MAG: NAD(P)H-dependent glycerol-3-phosphate dehydrogenase [Eubacteriaceae bacterium]|jgi:glycerol-3-phosphate dehydrogenase (NAD(P)+)|nr:NAD(P)H-dependent glycerol-3-phosphate dehydrogenase [Eubacteriaceae bacterium]
MNVAVIGCGRWGTFHAVYSADIGHKVILWGREGSVNMRHLMQQRRNEYIELPDSVELTHDIAYAVNASQYIIISISAQQLRDFLQSVRKLDFSDKTLILCMKGIEQGSGKRLTQVVEEFLPAVPVAVWVGPGHVQNYVQKIPNCMVVDSKDKNLTARVVRDFNTQLMRLYIGEDIVGAEVGAAAKNVIGIAAGILDGMGFTSLKGALMARGAREVSRLIKAMGGNELTAYGLSHLGDYEATLFSLYSNNRKFGEAFVKKEVFDKLAEGVYTTDAMLLLAHKYEVDLPITKGIKEIIYYNKDPGDVMSSLFIRSIKTEFDD